MNKLLLTIILFAGLGLSYNSNAIFGSIGDAFKDKVIDLDRYNEAKPFRPVRNLGKKCCKSCK